MSEYREMVENVQVFFSKLEKEIVEKISDEKLQEEIKALIKSDFQDRNFLNMVAARMKAKGEGGSNIKNVTDSIKKRIENFHPNVRYIEVDKMYLS